MNRKMLCVAALTAVGFCGTASANITVGSATGNTPAGGATTPALIPVQFAGDGDGTVGFQARVVFSTTAFPTDPTVTAANGAVCNVQAGPAAGTRAVFIQYNDPGNAAIPAGPTTFCNMAFTVPASAPVGPIALDAQFVTAAGDGCFDAAAAATTCNLVDGSVTISSGPAAPTVAPLAALTLPAGPINLTATGNVPVSIATTGTATASVALACTIPATGASAFAVTSGGTQTINAPATVGPGTPIGVSCVRGAADVTATLTCTQTATPGPNPANLTAAITCPAGTVAPNPGSSPAAPGPVNLTGAPGATATGGVTFTNAGGTATYQVLGCTPSAGYATTTAFPVNLAIGGSGSVSVTCTAPTAAGTSGPTGTLACTTSAAGFNPTFNLTCSAQSLSIPTLGWGGKALMALLMLGFGLVGFQLYRRSA